MKKFLFALFVVVAGRVEAQTFVAPEQDFSLSYYQDSDGYTVDSAVSDLGIPGSEPRAFRIRVFSKRNIIYADSWGSRLRCSAVKGALRCEYRGTFVEETNGADCKINATYAFSVIRRGSWSSLFHEEIQCDDGWSRVLEYSGPTKVRMIK